MKRIFSYLTIAALALAITPTFAFAHDNMDGNAHLGFGAKIAAFVHQVKDTDTDNDGQNRFGINGTVVSSTVTSLTVNVQNKHSEDNPVVLTNGQAIVVVNSDTKIMGKGKVVLAITDLAVGDRVGISGSVSGSVLTAVAIRDMGQLPMKAFGKVTAVNSSSVTLLNSLTGTSQTVAVNGDTKVTIDGESKTVSDISVGDVGWVKFKSIAGAFIASMIHLFR